MIHITTYSCAEKACANNNLLTRGHLHHNMNISLNHTLDLETLSSAFAKQGRLRIENFLTEESAAYIADNLKNNTPWHLVHSDDNGLPVRYNPNQLAHMSSQQLEIISAQLKQDAHNYKYTYKFFPIIDAIKANEIDKTSMLFQLANFLNGTEFIALSRKLTDTNTLVKVDPQASLYEAGHFLTTHDDSNYQRAANDTSTRRFAIVLGFTKDWSWDWGGQTSFFDNSDAIASESWKPGFNVLTIFRVPTLHCVNYVAPFAGHGRYSVTGWLRDDPNVSRPDLGDR
jgi:SM-20-related protein